MKILVMKSCVEKLFFGLGRTERKSNSESLELLHMGRSARK